MSAPLRASRLYGLMAEFESPADLVRACRGAYAEGYRKMDAYTPFPVEAAWEALGIHRNRMPLIVLCAAIIGGCSGMLLQWWTSTVSYPLNIAGKPYFSLPAFIPITFEMTILFGVLSCVFGMLALNGLPMPYHPVFNAPRFALATRDRFFLCIEAADPRFDLDGTRRFLERFTPRSVSEVEE